MSRAEANTALSEQKEQLLLHHQQSKETAAKEKSKLIEKISALQSLLDAVAAGEPVVDSDGNDLVSLRDAIIVSREGKKHSFEVQELKKAFELVSD